MAFDQNITYRVNVDDTDFQAKLSQLRASLDMTMGGSAFAGMGMAGAGFTGPMMSSMAMMGAPQGGYSGMGMAGLGGGFADFGAQIRPITYTPPAISIQPHFGMVALQQSAPQSFFGSMGPLGIGAASTFNFIRHPLSTQPNVVPPNMSLGEYSALSARAFGTRLGDATATAGLVAAGTAVGMVGSGVGGAIGEFMGGGMLGGLAGGLLGGAAVSAYVNQVGDMMAQNRAVQTQLEAGSFRFVTGGADVDPLTGRGFSRAARARVADFVQSSELKDLRYGMPEMREILESGMQMDMFSGASDIESFKQRFKGLVESMKTITSTLHTSIQEGMEVMRGLRDIGVTDPAQMTGIVTRAETLGRMSGRTGMEMLAIGQQGAELFRGTGVRMGLGLDTEMQNATLVRQMLNMGTISRETVAQAGGENALAHMLTASALASTQSAVGRGAMLGMFDPSTGGLDFSFKGGTFGVLGRAASRSPMDILNFQARQEEIVSNMSPQQLQLFGLQVDLMQAKTVTDAFMGGREGTPEYQKALENQFINMEKRRGVPIAAIRANLGMLHTDPTQLREQQQTALASMAQQASLEDLRNTFNITKAASNWLQRTLVQPVQRFFTGIGTSVATGFENLSMTMMGASLANPIGMDRDSIARGRALIESGAAALPDVIDASGNFLQRNLIPGGGQSGEALAAAMQQYGGGGLNYQGLSGMTFKSVDDVKKFAASHHQSLTILTRTAKGDMPVIAVATKQLDRAKEQQDRTQPTADDVARANETKLSTDQIAAIERIKVRQGELHSEAGFQNIGRALFGDKFMTDAASAGFQRAMTRRVAEEEGFGRALSEERASGRGFSGANIRGGADVMEAAHRSLAEAQSIMDTATDKKLRLGGVFKSSALSHLSEQQRLIALRMAAAGDDPARLGLRHSLGKTGVSESDIEQLEREFSGALSADQKKDIQKKLDGVDVANFAASEEQNKGAGILGKIKDLFAGSTAVGQMSPDQTKSVSDLANQTLETMKLIAELQKYVKDNMPRR